MKYLKTYTLFERVSKYTKEYLKDIEVSLKDVGLKITYQEQSDKIVMYISGGLGVYFTLEQIRYDVGHTINMMEGSGHKLLSARYMIAPKRYWVDMYDNAGVNRWGIAQQKEDIFDIQDLDLSKDKILSFELKFSI